MTEYKETEYNCALEAAMAWPQKLNNQENYPDLKDELIDFIRAFSKAESGDFAFNTGLLFALGIARETANFHAERLNEIYLSLTDFQQTRFLNMLEIGITNDPSQKKAATTLERLRNLAIPDSDLPKEDNDISIEKIDELTREQLADLEASEDLEKIRHIARILQDVILKSQYRVQYEQEELVSQIVAVDGDAEGFEILSEDNQHLPYEPSAYEYLKSFCVNLGTMRPTQLALENLETMLKLLDANEISIIISIFESHTDDASTRIIGLLRKVYEERSADVASLDLARRKKRN